MLDPSHVKAKKAAVKSDPTVTNTSPVEIDNSQETPVVSTIPQTTPEQDKPSTDQAPEFLRVNPVAPYAQPHDNTENTKEEV
jgi:hypothetical protein